MNHTDQSNFTIYVHLSDARFKSVGNGGNVQSSSGYDLIPYADATCSTRLHFKRNTYSATAGTADFWVLVPTLSHTADTYVYFCYDNTGITTDQQDPASAWDGNYTGAWHLSYAGSLDTSDDLGLHNGTATGTVSGTTGGPGVIPYGHATFAGSGGVQLASAAMPAGTQVTAEAWYQVADGGQYGLLTKTNGGDAWPYWNVVSGNRLYLFEGSGSGTTNVSSNSTPAANTWTHVAFVMNTATPVLNVYVNGVLDSTNAVGFTVDAGSYTAWLGNDNQNEYLKGAMSEARFSTTARSADWIVTEYNSQCSPSATCHNGVDFATLGSESPVGTCSSATITGVSPLVPAFLGAVAPGNTASIVVSPPGCSWAASAPSWVTITSGGSGTGNGTITYTVAANSGVARSGSLTANSTAVTSLPVQQATVDATGYAPRFLQNLTSVGLHASGSGVDLPITAVVNEIYRAGFSGSPSVPMTANLSAQTFTLDSSYTPTGTETRIFPFSTGDLPGFLSGTCTSVSSGGTTTCTATLGTFTSAMNGNQIMVPYLYNGGPTYQTTFETATYVDSTHITFPTPGGWVDSTDAPWYYGGIYGVYDQAQAWYAMTNVSGHTVQLCQGDASSACAGGTVIQPFTDTGSGTLYLAFLPPGGPSYSFYITALYGLPAGTTASWYQPGTGLTPVTLPIQTTADLNNGSIFFSTLQLVFPTGSAGKTYHPIVTACQHSDGTGACTSIQWTVQAIAPATHMNVAPSPIPPLPSFTSLNAVITSATYGGLDQWYTGCSTLGACAINYTPGCTYPDGYPKLSPVCSSDLWYYQGSDVAYGVSNWTSTPLYLNVAQQVGSDYANSVLSDGTPQTFNSMGYNPHGLWELTSSGAAKTLANNALIYLQTNELPIYTGAIGEPSRYIALQLLVELSLEDEGGSPQPLTDEHAQTLEYQLISLDDGTSRPGTQPFYVGVVDKALIEYARRRSGNKMAMYAVQRGAHYLHQWYYPSAHSWIYNSSPVGWWCGNGPGLISSRYTYGPGATWFNSDLDGHCRLNADEPGSQALNNIINYVQSVLWSLSYTPSSGDNFQTDWDDSFNYSFNPSYVAQEGCGFQNRAFCGGKQYNQAFWLSLSGLNPGSIAIRSGTSVLTVSGYDLSVSATPRVSGAKISGAKVQ